MYAFIHIPKTGGSTLRHMLRLRYGARHCDIRPPRRNRKDVSRMIEPVDLVRIRRVYPSLAGICGHRVTACHELDAAVSGLRFFTMLREPTSRFMSHFSHWARDRGLAGSLQDFDEFCRDPLMANLQSRMLGGLSCAKTVDQLGVFVGLMESFDESVLMLGHWLGDERWPQDYAVHNAGKRKASLRLDEHADVLQRVIDFNAEDIALYEHVRDTIFPMQRSRFEGHRGDLSVQVDQLQRRSAQSTQKGEGAWPKIKRNMLYKPMRQLRLV